MAFKKISLWCLHALLPLLVMGEELPVDQKQNGACVFPFFYNGKTYSSCTSAGRTDGLLWCSLSSKYNEDRKWKICSASDQKQQGPCVFPFTYNGKTYSTCTSDGKTDGLLWCSLSNNYNEDRKWKICNASDQKQKGPCVFPFTYNGKTYSTCTSAGKTDGSLWCSLTSRYNEDRKWKICNATDLKQKGPCVFPFTYNGKTYSICTSAGRTDGLFWCSLTSKYNEDRKWKVCNASDQKQKGPCVFPFTYNGKTYSTCTSAGKTNGSLWCSLTSKYNEDRKWKICNASDRKQKGPCVFPFSYNGKTYSTCTSAGRSDGMRWCSLTSNYDEDRKWKICKASDARMPLSNVIDSFRLNRLVK